MEKRANKRIPFSLDAKIISGGKTYDGTVENVSRDGIEYLMTSVVQTPEDFTPDKIIELTFRTPAGDAVNLRCDVKWYLEVEPREKKLILGMEILAPPPAYRELLKQLEC
jgi:hypothetical protein